MEKEFILTKAQWEDFYKITNSSIKLSRGNHHYHLNEAISSFFIKPSSNLKIKSNLSNYFQKNSKIIQNITTLHDDKFKLEKLSNPELENIKKIEQNIINEYLDCLTPLNLYEVKNELLIFTALSTGHMNDTSSNAFYFLEKNGLNLENYFNEFLTTSNPSSLRFSANNISKFWFEFHENNKTKPDQDNSLLLIKSLFPKENVLTMDNVETASYYLNRIDRTQETLEYLMSLTDRSKNANMFKAINNILKKYPKELYNQVKDVFEDKNSIQTQISHLEIVQYKIDPLSLNLSGYLKASEVNSFLMAFNEAFNGFIGNKFPQVKLFEKSKNYEFNFVTDNQEDKKNVTDFITNLDSAFQYLLASYDKKQAPIKNTPVLTEAMEKILFQIKLDDSLDTKTSKSQKRKI